MRDWLLVSKQEKAKKNCQGLTFQRDQGYELESFQERLFTSSSKLASRGSWQKRVRSSDLRCGSRRASNSYYFQPGDHLHAEGVRVIKFTPSLESGKKKAHKHKLFCPVGPSFHWICPRDKPSLSLGQIRCKTGTNPGILLILYSGSPISPGLSLGQTWFVPGTIPGTKGGTESLCEKSLCAFFARY